MKIEIWSDIACPFCYIGKRKLETALEKFPYIDQVKIDWKSFQLNPDLKTNPDQNSLEHLSKVKGWSMDQTRQITQQVVAMAKTEGLEYDLEHTVVANTKNAHRLIHLAKENNLQSEMKERLLKAYFTEGKNVDDFDTLVGLATEIGLNATQVKAVLESNQFSDAVENDIYQARLVGVQGVPFFVLDRKFGISGAQPDQVFDQTLEKAWDDFVKENPELQIVQGSNSDFCEIDGDC